MSQPNQQFPFVGIKEPLDLTKEQAVSIIRNMPDYLMEFRHGIHIRNSDLMPGQKIFFNAVRDEYRYRADWLIWDLLDDKKILPELRFTRASEYKAFGKESLAFQKLAKAIIERYDSPITQTLSSYAWMALCEIDQCATKLETGGFSGHAKTIGKRQLYEIAVEYYTHLESVKESSFCHQKQKRPDESFCLTWLQALESIGTCIAATDNSFRNNQFRDYTLARKRAFGTLNRSKRFSVLHLKPNGELEELQKGKGKRKGEL